MNNDNEILRIIQESISPFHNIDLEELKHEKLVNYDENLKYFLMDAFTRCINAKKLSEGFKHEQTTHCAAYFKIIPFGQKDKVLKLLIASNKNSGKLLNRTKKNFQLKGLEIKSIQNKYVIKRVSNYLDPDSFTEKFLSCTDFKKSNLYCAMAYFFKILKIKYESNESKNNSISNSECIHFDIS